MAVQKIQGTAPQSKQQLLSNKLANIASSEDEEREKINALTRSGGLLGILQVLLSSYVFLLCLPRPTRSSFLSLSCKNTFTGLLAWVGGH